MKKNDTFRRAAALVAALSITVSLAAPAFAGTYYIDDGDITIIKNENGSQTIKQQGKEDCTDQVGDETIITTHKKAITTLESDLEGPAAEDSGFGPVVEDNYQPAQPESTEEPEGTDQPEDAEKPEGTDQPEDAEEPKSADQPENTDRQEDADQPESAEEPKAADRQESAGQQPQPQQAAPAAAAAPAASTSNGFLRNTITVINNFANTVLNLTLKDVKIDVSDTGNEGRPSRTGKAALSVQGKGNVEIELDGENELKSGAYRAGLEKNNSTSAGTLTLKDNKEAGSGSLNAEGGALSAGIGACYEEGTKNIIITGGTVTATGGDGGAGIGGGDGGGAENITITGSTVTATGGSAMGFGGAGIGGGSDGRNSDSNGKNITITGSTVTAKGGNGSAGIGGGVGGSGESITITGSTVTAEGGNGAAGIGSGNGKNITITDSTVTATGKYGGAGIGGGNGKNGEAITITGSTVTATGKYGGAGIGGGGFDGGGNGNHITITGSTVIATSEGVGERGNRGGAGIGGGCIGNGENIAITGSTVTATGHFGGAGIGGGYKGSGSNVTVSGAAQVTAIAFAGDRWDGVGATIGSGSSGSKRNPDGTLTPGSGQEIKANISGLTTGYIHHIIYDPALVSEDNPDGILKEWWEPERPQPNPEDPNAPAEESNEVDLGTPLLHVETLEGVLLPFDAQQQGSTLRVTSDNLAARLHGTRQALEALREQGVEQIQFVTSFKTTTLSVEELLAEGGSWFALEHNGLVSRQLSAAQAESLKCRMR
jgi:outer membrane biosynthesis protein TonB